MNIPDHLDLIRMHTRSLQVIILDLKPKKMREISSMLAAILDRAMWIENTLGGKCEQYQEDDTPGGLGG